MLCEICLRPILNYYLELLCDDFVFRDLILTDCNAATVGCMMPYYYSSTTIKVSYFSSLLILDPPTILTLYYYYYYYY